MALKEALRPYPNAEALRELYRGHEENEDLAKTSFFASL